MKNLLSKTLNNGKKVVIGLTPFAFGVASAADPAGGTAGWDAAPIVKAVLGTIVLIVAIGGAILSVKSSRFGFDTMKSMLSR